MMPDSLTERPVMVMLGEVEEEFDGEYEDELTEIEELSDVVVFPNGLSVAFELEEEFGGVVGFSEDEEFQAKVCFSDLLMCFQIFSLINLQNIKFLQQQSSNSIRWLLILNRNFFLYSLNSLVIDNSSF